MMDWKQDTEASRALFVDAANQAKELGAKEYIIAIGNELARPQLHIFDAAQITDGTIYWKGQDGTLSKTWTPRCRTGCMSSENRWELGTEAGTCRLGF